MHDFNFNPSIEPPITLEGLFSSSCMRASVISISLAPNTGCAK